MELAMIGLGKMGGNMTGRLLRGGHRMVVYNRSPEPVRAAEAEGAVGTTSIAELVTRLQARPRVAWAIACEARESDIKVARLQFDVLRWRAARLAPKAYRDEEEAKGGLEVYLQDFSSGAILAGPIWSGPGS